MPTSYFTRKQALRLTTKGRWQEASVAWRRLLATRGARPSDYVRFVRAVARSEGEDAAVRAFEGAVRRFPIDANVQRQQGLHLLQRHRAAEACLAFARARALSPADDVIRSDLAHLSVGPAQERSVAVRAYLEAQEPLAPVEGRLDRLLTRGALRKAQRAAKAGDWAEAARLYRQVLRRRPGYAHGYLKLGHALKEAGDLKGAETAYWRAVALASAKAGPFLHLGHVLKLNGDAEAALTAYLAAWMIEPANAEVNAELLGHGHQGADLKRLANERLGGVFSLEALSSSGNQSERKGGDARPLPLATLLTELAVKADLARLLAVEAR